MDNKADHDPLLVETKGIPRKEGVGDREIIPEDGPLYHQARVSKAAGLKDLEEEYAFYSHALLFTHGAWHTDPVGDFIHGVNPDCHPVALQLPVPVFKGLAVNGNAFWEGVVFAVHKTHWFDLRAFLGSLSAVDRQARRYHRVAVQEVPLVDVLALTKKESLPAKVPMTTVTLFAVEGSWGTVGYAPAVNPPVDRIRVITQPPEPDVVKLCKAVFAELEKPFQVVEPTAEEAERKARESVYSGKPRSQ